MAVNGEIDPETNEEIDSNDTFRILVSSNNLLGSEETDAVRCDDSYTAFEEILELAVIEHVDFILLGGNLFHTPEPSDKTELKLLTLLNRYTHGEKPIAFEILGDQKFNIRSEDPTLNISIPVFVIHGNRDDVSASLGGRSLDVLPTAGMVNYIGSFKDLRKTPVSPIRMRKGRTQLTLYGLNHIRESRLTTLVESGTAKIKRPSNRKGEWFHLMALHQARVEHAPRGYDLEEMLPKFLHLVVWGHEHDCRIEPKYNDNRDFYTCQPGSSVATALTEGESSSSKHVGLLEVYKTQFRLKPLPLKSVRPFVFESVNVSGTMVAQLRLDEGDASNKVRRMAEERVKAMIRRAKDQLTGHPSQPTLPLIRLCIIVEEEPQMFDAISLGQSFAGQVANPSDCVYLKKAATKQSREGSQHFDKNSTELRLEATLEESTQTKPKTELDECATVPNASSWHSDYPTEVKPKIELDECATAASSKKQQDCVVISSDDDDDIPLTPTHCAPGRALVSRESARKRAAAKRAASHQVKKKPRLDVSTVSRPMSNRTLWEISGWPRIISISDDSDE